MQYNNDCIIHKAMFLPKSILYGRHQYNIYIIQYTLYNIHYTQCSSPFTYIYSVQCTLYTIQRAQYIQYCTLSALYCCVTEGVLLHFVPKAGRLPAVQCGTFHQTVSH